MTTPAGGSILAVDPHPLLDVALLEVKLSAPLSALTSTPELLEGLARDAEVPMVSSDTVRLKVRDLLRHGGFKPTGRSKPASEYLIKAADNGFLGPINLLVDACNVVSLHSGLPISVVDLDRTHAPLRLGLADPDASYVFNASGQTIDIGTLLCLADAEGPCANAVKDSQRTKTHDETRRCLYVIWGTIDLAGRTEETAAWLTQVLAAHGAEVIRRRGDGR
jgi:DNA/RNA-binding domain of Phe-tRNA-synthetase-like protein